MTKAKTAVPAADARLGRILEEGYGPGAWHGPDLKAALLVLRQTLVATSGMLETAARGHAWN